MDTVFGRRLWAQPVAPVWESLPVRRTYEVLRAYYHSNDLYANIQIALRERGIWTPAMKPLRNPAYRVCEFYAAKIWGGPLKEALTIETEHEAIIPAIEQVWSWSNWGSQKQHAARTLAMTGDWFCKVATRRRGDDGPVERVYLQTIEPEYVTDFTEDERGYLTYIRIDVPQAERLSDGKTRSVTHTEVWEHDDDRYRIWAHTKQADEELGRLGTPQTDATLTSLGIDFVPFVRAMLRDVGRERGMAAILPAKDKIDEANMQATRLHQMLYRHNQPTWAITSGGLDGSGRPIPPVRLADGTQTPPAVAANGTAAFSEGDVVSLPGAADLKSLVPNIQYTAALAILDAMMAEIEKDLPELAYYALRSRADLSGKAVRLLLSDAIDRLEEARGNAFAALIQAHAMALTIGAQNGLPDFRGIGTFEAGSFAHALKGRPVIEIDAVEEEQVVTLQKDDLSWEGRMILRGWTPDEIENERERLEQDGTTPPGPAAPVPVTPEPGAAVLVPGQPDLAARAERPGGE